MDTRVYVARCSDYSLAADAVSRILDAFGGAAAILDGRRRVLVKPNLIMPRKPEDAATTHPAVVEAVCSAFVNVGAEVSIIDSTAGPHTKIMLKMLYGKSGISLAAKQSGAKVSFDTSVSSIAVPDGKVVRKLDILKPVDDADLVISVAKAKTHGFMSMTGCVKNLFGCIPGMGKPMMHRKFSKREDFAAMLIDLCQYVSPQLSILDGVWGMEGAGPTGGDPKQLGIIAGGISPYAVDLAQCYLMGLRRDNVPTLHEAAARGLVPDDPAQITWLGDDPEPFRTFFKPAAPQKKDALPSITDGCIGCGDCARICPQKCIDIQNGRASVNGKSCIRCYCCHEFCPAKAITI